MVGQTTFLVPAPQADHDPARRLRPCPAQQLPPQQRQELALQVLAGTQPVARPGPRSIRSAASSSTNKPTPPSRPGPRLRPARPAEEVLFHLPVTKAWLRQLVLALVLICHSSYRGVIDLLRDLFDTKLSLGTVHNIVQAAVARAREINGSHDLAGVRVGAHDEIFQAGRPVLVGVDTASTFCYLLSQEEHRDADTWGVRLLELADRGFAPEATVADFGTGLRAGQALALPEVPCRGDVFHLVHDLEQAVTYLENRAYDAIEACARLEREQAPSNGKAGPRTAWPSDCGGPGPPATRPSPWRTTSGCWGSGSARTCWRWPGRATRTAWCCTTSSWPNCGPASPRARTGCGRSTAC